MDSRGGREHGWLIGWHRYNVGVVAAFTDANAHHPTPRCLSSKNTLVVGRRRGRRGRGGEFRKPALPYSRGDVLCTRPSDVVLGQQWAIPPKNFTSSSHTHTKIYTSTNLEENNTSSKSEQVTAQHATATHPHARTHNTHTTHTRRETGGMTHLRLRTEKPPPQSWRCIRNQRLRRRASPRSTRRSTSGRRTEWWGTPGAGYRSVVVGEAFPTNGGRDR